MFSKLSCAIANLNNDASDIETALNALRIEYKRFEKLYTYSIEVWYQLTDSTLSNDDILALMALLSRLPIIAGLTFNNRFIILKIALEP